jgi:hypothetical protein
MEYMTILVILETQIQKVQAIQTITLNKVLQLLQVYLLLFPLKLVIIMVMSLCLD